MHDIVQDLEDNRSVQLADNYFPLYETGMRGILDDKLFYEVFSCT
jgi:hypothetical protein